MVQLAGVVALGAAGFLAIQWLAPRSSDDGPVPVVWDKAVCAECRMHVGEPAFAAQLQTADGGVYDFDDPGCLFEYFAEHAPELRAAWFHHHQEDRWLRHDEVAFVPVKTSPMGFGLGAVAAGPGGGRTFDDIVQRGLDKANAGGPSGSVPHGARAEGGGVAP
jgi:hypothetical protein